VQRLLTSVAVCHQRVSKVVEIAVRLAEDAYTESSQGAQCVVACM
jgi:hypothetical protein